ncbi:MAG: hypothetical protein R6U38_16765 [Desulfatiglandaceae bacterium]
MNSIPVVEKIMTDFAESTGLLQDENPPRRYLWTDAFAVCNFLELYRRTEEAGWRQTALDLVEQVHNTLGRHREDDPRTGWISGLSEEEGKRHPTMGGLRIGKEMKERQLDEPYDERLEWDRDGQYYHYLTRWMHALNRVSRSTGDPVYNSWAIELAKAAHNGFVQVLKDGSKIMYWKMSIDLSYPQVPSMGQHDALDGLVTYHQLQATAVALSAPGLDLVSEIADMAGLCQGRRWATDDPLGIGGLLCDAYKIARLIMDNSFTDKGLLKDLLESSMAGVNAYSTSRSLKLPAAYRLAFRELGLAIGLHAVERMEELTTREKSDQLAESRPVMSVFRPHFHLGETIEKFWLDPQNRQAPSWSEHRDINSVMLATSLAPDGYLEL